MFVSKDTHYPQVIRVGLFTANIKYKLKRRSIKEVFANMFGKFVVVNIRKMSGDSLVEDAACSEVKDDSLPLLVNLQVSEEEAVEDAVSFEESEEEAVKDVAIGNDVMKASVRKVE